MYVSRVCTQTDRHRYRHARCICCCCWWICICICSTHLWGERESELSVSVSVSVSINKSAADCSGFSLEMVKRWSNMLLNRNCCCRSLFIIGIETRLVSLCFLLSTSFYRTRRWGESRGVGVAIVVAGARTCQADSFLYACVIYYPTKKKKNQKLVSAFSRRLLFSPQTDSSLLLLRFVSELHLFLGNLFVYISYVCVCVWTGERSKNKPRMKMNYARLQFFFIFLSNANSNFLISLRRLHKQQAGTSLTLTFAISLSWGPLVIKSI